VPLLNKEGLEALQAKPCRVCPTCRHAVRPNYCRECDVFFEAGHQAPECEGGGHDTHRTY
jgi:hypothetical protein